MIRVALISVALATPAWAEVRPALDCFPDAIKAKYGLADGVFQTDVCAVTRIERAEGTQIGTYLVEVSQ